MLLVMTGSYKSDYMKTYDLQLPNMTLRLLCIIDHEETDSVLQYYRQPKESWDYSLINYN